MIDERHEELAALYALDLLEGAELTAFESALAHDAELRRLVASLRETSAALALAAPTVPAPSANLRPAKSFCSSSPPGSAGPPPPASSSPPSSSPARASTSADNSNSPSSPSA
jgi:hypothetical protein